MRRTVLAVVFVVIAMCLLASGTQRDMIKVYFTVGSRGGLGGSQLWRCNRDGSEPELLLDEGEMLWDVDVDSGAQKLFYCEYQYLFAADLDGTNQQSGQTGYIMTHVSVSESSVKIGR